MYTENFRRGDVRFQYMKIVDIGIERQWNMCVRVTALPAGGLLMVWVASPDIEASDQNAIWVARSLDDGETWSAPVIIQNSNPTTPQQDQCVINPVLYTHTDHTIFVFYLDNSVTEQSTMIRKLPAMADPLVPENWSAPERIKINSQFVDGGIFSPPIRLEWQRDTNDGSVVMPWHFRDNATDKLVGTCLISRDGCKTWNRGGEFRVPDDGAILGNADEPSIAESAEGRLIAFVRTSNGRLYRADSMDCGHTWSDPMETQFVSPNAPAQVLRLQSTNIVLVWNNANPKEDPVVAGDLRYLPRCSLSVVASRDHGKTWGPTNLIETNAADRASQLTNHGVYQTESGNILVSVFDGMTVLPGVHPRPDKTRDIGPIRQASFNEAFALTGLAQTQGAWKISNTVSGGVRWDGDGLLLISDGLFAKTTTISPEIQLLGDCTITFVVTDEERHPSSVTGFFIGGDPLSEQPHLAFCRTGIAGDSATFAHPADSKRPLIPRFPCLTISNSAFVKERERVFSVDNYFAQTSVTIEVRAKTSLTAGPTVRYRDSNGVHTGWLPLPLNLEVPERWGFFARNYGVQARLRVHSISVT